MENLLRKVLATSNPGEVAFIHMPKERVIKSIFTARFGSTAEVEEDVDSDGITYSLTWKTIKFCFRCKESTIFKLGTWNLSIPPCVDRTITSVALPSNPAHAMDDAVAALFIPGRVAETNGMTVVHFFREEDAEKFIQKMT